jgi:hypothetical protein
MSLWQDYGVNRTMRVNGGSRARMIISGRFFVMGIWILVANMAHYRIAA